MITLDSLINAVAITGISLLILSSFFYVYRDVENALIKGHLSYLSAVIEDRMAACHYMDNVPIYAPYEVNADCVSGHLCKGEICVPVLCKGGGTGREFLLHNCSILPVK